MRTDPCSITWRTWREDDAKRGRGGKEISSASRSENQKSKVMTQMTQSFNPGIHRRIQKTFLNPTVLKWLALARCVSFRMNVIREFKIRRLRTTAKVKHATAHDQNHVTVYFSHVVLPLRWVVELFRVVGTTENILVVFCRLGHSRISSFRKKVFNYLL